MAIQNRAKRPAWVAQRMETLVKQRTGITRHNTALTIKGLSVKNFIGAPEILRERYFRKPRGRRYYFAVVRFKFIAQDGQCYTVLRAQTHDADRGYCLSITGFWGLKSA